MTKITNYQVGILVKVNASFLGEPKGVIAYVYENYSNGGISLITQNGKDLGGFSTEEQGLFLEYFKQTAFIYQFENVTKLAIDWKKDIFKSVFFDLTPQQVKFNGGYQNDTSE